jgi:hypothetical protein
MVEEHMNHENIDEPVNHLNGRKVVGELEEDSYKEFAEPHLGTQIEREKDQERAPIPMQRPSVFVNGIDIHEPPYILPSEEERALWTGARR